MRRAFLAFAALAVATYSPLAAIAGAEVVMSSPPAAAAVWSSVTGGESACHDVGTTGVACVHAYDSDYDYSGETCREPSVALPNCHVSLGGSTSGTGRQVAEDGSVSACVTDGIKTLTFRKQAGATGEFPAFKVTAQVDNGLGKFSGSSDPQVIPGVGTVIQSAHGTFSMGCGGGAGSFAGSWSLVAANLRG